MHLRDCAASAKVGFFPGSFQVLSPAQALALAMVLGWGLSAASLNVVLNHSQASMTAQAIQTTQEIKAEPSVATVAINGTANTVPPAKAWPQRSERNVAGLEGAGCTAECLKTLRQRLLDHHRQAAPVWVF